MLNTHQPMKTMFTVVNALLLSACMHVGEFDAIKGSGKIATENRTITGFTRISLEGSADVYVTQGAAESIRIEADDNLLQHITTEVTGGELEISNRESISPSQNVKVFITARSLEGLSIAGSGIIVTETPFSANTFELAIAGSGDIKARVNADVVDASIAGSGDIVVAGSAKSSSISIAGSGDYKAYDLSANTADISIAGSGDCELIANESLTASIMGSGSVYYKGEPKISSSIMGSGSIERK